MEYIDFTIIDKHIVCRRSGVIADNTDYMMRFAFDEGWDGYPDKTVLVLDNEGKIHELHLTDGATEVRLPKFIGRRLLAVGVTATAGDGEISTDAVSLRVNPSIRTGASEVIESPESGAKDMLEEFRQKYDALIAELQAAIDSTYLGVTGAEVGQTVRITEVDEDGNPVAWEAVDFPEQIQTDFEQTDETAADYLKNRPFGNVAYDGIVFEKVFVFGGYNLVHVPGFDVLANIQGLRQAEIRRGGNVVNTGSASVSVSDRDGSISIKYNSTAGTIIEFKGSNGYLSEINVQSNTDITSVSEYTLHIDGLYYEEYIKLSADKVEGTLPSAGAANCVLISTSSGNNWSVTKISTDFPLASATGRGAVKVGDGLSISSDGKLSVDMSDLDTKSLGISGATVGQIVKIKAVDESGAPTEWEAVEFPEQVQSDWNQADKTAADYVKNRPFGNVAYEGILFGERGSNGWRLERVPDASAFYDIQGTRQAEIRGTGLVLPGSANISASDYDGSVNIEYTSTSGHTIINISGKYGVIDNINVQSSEGVGGWGTFELHIDGLYYEGYIKLSADKVDIDTKSLGLTGVTVGQTVKIKAVDENGVPTEWEAVTDSTPFIVEFGGRGSEDEPYTSSHTYDQIAAAVSAGRYVIGYAGWLGVDGDPAIGRYGIYFNLTSMQDTASFEFVDSYNSYRISVIVLSPSGLSVGGSYLDAKSYSYGGVKADDAEETDTQPVRKGADGKLYTSKSLGITGASVGQIVKIKSVDSSGKPTAWEAADMASGGTDTSLGLTGVTVGQTVKIKAVDENGVPTEWEPADMPSGEDEWIQLCNVKLTEATQIITQTWVDTPMRKIKVSLTTLAASANTNYMPTRVLTSPDAAYAFRCANFYPTALPITSNKSVEYIAEVYNVSGNVHLRFTEYYGGIYGNKSDLTAGYLRTENVKSAESTGNDGYGDGLYEQITGFHVETYGTFEVGTKLKIWGVAL